MINQELRKRLEDEDVIFFENPSYDNSIIGLTYDNRLVYSLDKMILELSQDDQITQEEALDFIEYNTNRALPYITNGPIVMEELNERF